MVINLKLQQGLKEYNRKLAAGEIEKAEVLDPIEKAKQNPKSLRAAINAHCFQCSCYQRIEVTLCTAKDCPLHNLRPWQRKG